MPQARKIIISDNDQSFLASCQNAFELLGMQVIPVPKHGSLLWDAIEKERPDLVVCNIFMAYCDAIHIMEHLSQSAVPVPVFGRSYVRRITSAYSAGFYQQAERMYLSSPSDATILAERVFIVWNAPIEKAMCAGLIFCVPPPRLQPMQPSF